jgi:hypothetical protein
MKILLLRNTTGTGIEKTISMLDAVPRSAGDHLAQNFLRKIKLISLTILH